MEVSYRTFEEGRDMTLKLQQKKVFGIDLDDYNIDKRIEKRLVEIKSRKVLVFGSIDGIYYFDGSSVKKIAKRNGVVTALEVCNGKLYDVGVDGKIYRTINNEVVAKRGSFVRALEVWNRKLYDAGDYEKIYITSKSEVVAERDGWVRALEVWNGDLYDAGDYGKIYITMYNEVVVDFGKPIYCMLAVPRSVLMGLVF